jgi:hypothetical protein
MKDDPGRRIDGAGAQDERIINSDPKSRANGPSSQEQQAQQLAPERKRRPSWRDVLKVHPAAELFPLMSNDELLALGEDIKKNGLRNRIAVIDGPDDDPILIDGRNRLDAMELAGLEVIRGGKLNREVVQTSILEGDPYEYVISVNIRRRHLTAEQKSELIAAVLKAKPETSNRQIAKQVKADDKTVGKVRRELEATAELPQLEKTIGADGKARKPPGRRRVNPKSAPKPDPARSITTCLSAVRIAVEVALVAKRGDAEHQSLVFENVRRCLAEMEQARLGGAP